MSCELCLFRRFALGPPPAWKLFLRPCTALQPRVLRRIASLAEGELRPRWFPPCSARSRRVLTGFVPRVAPLPGCPSPQGARRGRGYGAGSAPRPGRSFRDPARRAQWRGAAVPAWCGSGQEGSLQKGLVWNSHHP